MLTRPASTEGREAMTELMDLLYISSKQMSVSIAGRIDFMTHEQRGDYNRRLLAKNKTVKSRWRCAVSYVLAARLKRNQMIMTHTFPLLLRSIFLTPSPHTATIPDASLLRSSSLASRTPRRTQVAETDTLAERKRGR